MAESQKETIEGQIEMAEGQIEMAEGQTEMAEGQIEMTEGQMEMTEGQIETTEGQTEMAEGQTEMTEGQTDMAEGQIETAEGQTEMAEDQLTKTTEGQIEMTGCMSYNAGQYLKIAHGKEIYPAVVETWPLVSYFKRTRYGWVQGDISHSIVPSDILSECQPLDITMRGSRLFYTFHGQLKLGSLVIEGKTKAVYDIEDSPGHVLLQNKDRITAGDGARADDLKGKAAISTTTTVAIFELLNNAGIKTHYVRQETETSFVAIKCAMIPIEWVTRRIATGSFLRRNEGVKEGYRFSPPKQETFFKDDANHDPQWSYEQCVEAKLKVGGIEIGPHELDIMKITTVTVFEILEKCWSSLDCSLIDMKIEFGVNPQTGEILLSDVIDSDSWRLWPAGDRRLMKDKQVYRDLAQVTPEALDTVKRNFQWVADKVKMLYPKPHARAVVIMGSASDMSHCEKIKDSCKQYGVPCELRVSSAHKGTEETMRILAEYEGEGIPTVFIAVAGRSNGLGPVLSGNATWPVINCPPLSGDWGSHDIWSSMRLPSGLGCSTVMYPEGAGLCAAQILSLTDHVIWSKIRAKQLNTSIGLKVADKKCQSGK